MVVSLAISETLFGTTPARVYGLYIMRIVNRSRKFLKKTLQLANLEYAKQIPLKTNVADGPQDTDVYLAGWTGLTNKNADGIQYKTNCKNRILWRQMRGKKERGNKNAKTATLKYEN